MASGRPFDENADDEIGGELHSQYSLTYTPATREDHRLSRRSKSMWIAQAVKVRARPGFTTSPARRAERYSPLFGHNEEFPQGLKPNYGEPILSELKLRTPKTKFTSKA